MEIKDIEVKGIEITDIVTRGAGVMVKGITDITTNIVIGVTGAIIHVTNRDD
jgi:hypothetical protein